MRTSDRMRPQHLSCTYPIEALRILQQPDDVQGIPAQSPTALALQWEQSKADICSHVAVLEQAVVGLLVGPLREVEVEWLQCLGQKVELRRVVAPTLPCGSRVDGFLRRDVLRSLNTKILISDNIMTITSQFRGNRCTNLLAHFFTEDNQRYMTPFSLYVMYFTVESAKPAWAHQAPRAHVWS